MNAYGPSVIAGLFVSVTTLLDWFLNAPLDSRQLSADEFYRYVIFLERPRQVFAAPDLANDWWMVLMFAAAMFFLGYMTAKLVRGIYQSRLIISNNVFLKIIVLAALIMGFCGGSVLMFAAYMLPFVLKMYLAIVTAMLTFLGIYLILRSLYHFYLWWKQTRPCT